MGKPFKFDATAAVQTAWDNIWKSKLACQKTWKPEQYGYSTLFYITANELNGVYRNYAFRSSRGEPWEGTDNWDYGIRMSGNSMDFCRTFLKRLVYSGKAQSHNFGKGHISGERFRPYGAPIGPAEVRTQERKAKERASPRKSITHKSSGGYGSTPLCVIKANEAAGKRHYGCRPSKASSVSSWLRGVDCPRCLKFKPGETGPGQ